MSMQAIVCPRYGPPDVLELRDVPRPAPGDGEVLVEVHAAAVTATAQGARAGTPWIARLATGLFRPKHPILGVEFAGRVAAVGAGVTRFSVGDDVFGMTGATTPGAYAEAVCVPADGALLPLPAGVDHESAAALVEGGLTALHALRTKADVRPGQEVLVYGASGSVGTAGVQVAKHLGARVTAVCSGANAELVTSLGAERVIDYTQADFTEEGRSYDVIFSTLGKRSYGACRRSLTPRGVFVETGNAATLLPMLWTRVFGRRRAILVATYVRPAEAIREDLALVAGLMADGTLRPAIDRRYSLVKAAEAHRYVETGRKRGNVVIRVAADDVA